MDRQTVYPAAIPLDTDILSLQRDAMVALGYALQAAFGSGTVADGLACTPTAPASMTVNVGQGSIIALETIDATAWGSLAADTNPLVKIGVNAEGVTPFTLTAPGTSGQSINYLIEASFLESDATPVVLPYYNASNPSQPYSGPGNSGTTQNTQRIQRAQLQLKAGTAANTGTQTTPAVDAGWVGLWVVTVNYGQVTITAGAISEYPSAPFVKYKIPQLAPGFSNIQVFSSSGTFTVPPGVTKLKARVWGAGGGGGGSNGLHSGGSGGGGGGYSEGFFTVAPGTSITVTVGAGGTNGNNTPTNGGNGGASSFGSLISASGGGAGIAGNATVATTAGNGGTGFSGQIIIQGASGTLPTEVVSGTIQVGQGGAAFSTPANLQSNTSIAYSAITGLSPGGGAGGGALAGNGGAGAAGLVIVEW